MDELAHALGRDPLDLRLTNLSDARLRAVLQAAAERFGWGKTKATPSAASASPVASRRAATSPPARKSRSHGRAARSRSRARHRLRMRRPSVNPDHLRNQVEGSVVMGLGGALFEAVQFDAGVVDNRSSRSTRAPLLGCAHARDRAPRPQGPALGGSRGDADRRGRARGGGRPLHGDRDPAALSSPGPKGISA